MDTSTPKDLTDLSSTAADERAQDPNRPPHHPDQHAPRDADRMTKRGHLRLVSRTERGDTRTEP